MAAVTVTDLESVGIRKVKRAQGWCGRWRAYVLGEDRFGVWLYTPVGSLFRGGDGATMGECEVGQGDRDAGLPVVSLVPVDGWWFATWHGHCTDPWIAADICTPATFVDGEWTYIDLELDPHRTEDGRVWIADVDEFLAACDTGSISGDEQVAARAAASEIEQRLRVLSEPFRTAGWEWLRRAMAMTLAPLMELD
jgi:hypothetical protein